MQSDEIIDYIAQREVDYRLFDIKINNVGIYNYISRVIQEQLLTVYGFGLNYSNPKVPDKERKKALRKSFIQFLRLLFDCHKYDTIIRCFERVDFINGNYVDKFTDPLVDYSSLGENCIILEHGRSGRHKTPRCHSDKIIYVDFIYWLAWKFIFFRKKLYYRKYSSEIDLLFSRIEAAFPELNLNRDGLLIMISRFSFITKVYKFLFKKLHAKRLVAPSRTSFKHLIPAAKSLGLKVFELQHGLTYSQSITYSGFQDPLFTPDYFLSFGKIHNPESYGISKDRIIEIGWGFAKYVNNLNRKDDKKTYRNCILVISSPDISETMVSITCSFAEKYPDIGFFFRPHPLEIFSPQTKENLNRYNNIHINNNLENICVSLMKFDYVLGVNSTVLYEAVSMGKKVGKLNMYGLVPQFLQEEDRKSFYLISDEKSFVDFISDPNQPNSSIDIYTSFKPEVINSLLTL